MVRVSDTTSGNRQPRLLAQIRNVIRAKHYSIRAEEVYIQQDHTVHLEGVSSKRCKRCFGAESPLGLGAGGDDPLYFRAKEAVVEMGSPPTSLPAVVARRIENRVTGVRARTDRRSLETKGPNAT